MRLGALTHTRKQRWPWEDTKIICKNGIKRKIHKLGKWKTIQNLKSLEERRHMLNLKCSKNGIKYNDLNDLFPENEKYTEWKQEPLEIQSATCK